MNIFAYSFSSRRRFGSGSPRKAENRRTHMTKLPWSSCWFWRKVLDGKRFFAGEKTGFVDSSLGPPSCVIPMYEEITGVEMITEEKLPSLSAWMGNFLSSPVVKDHLPPLDKLRLRLQAIRIREACLSMAKFSSRGHSFCHSSASSASSGAERADINV
jgi:hypothetical protein